MCCPQSQCPCCDPCGMSPMYQASAARMYERKPSCVWCKTVAFLSVNGAPNLIINHPLIFPFQFFLLFKLKFWGSFFDICLYIIAVEQGIIKWWSATWILKALLAVVSLRSLSNMWVSFRHLWSMSHMGVVQRAPWPLESIWHHWVKDAVLTFKWTSSNNMWGLLCNAEDESYPNQKRNPV